MNKIYHNRNGNMHSEKSQEVYHEEQKAVEHEFKESNDLIKKWFNDNYEHFETKEVNESFVIKFKKSGVNKYKTLELKYGENYDILSKMWQ